MDMGPGTDLGGLRWHMGVWVMIMAVMMVPSAAPMVFPFELVSSERAKRGQRFVPTSIFVLGYFASLSARRAILPRRPRLGPRGPLHRRRCDRGCRALRADATQVGLPAALRWADVLPPARLPARRSRRAEDAGGARQLLSRLLLRLMVVLFALGVSEPDLDGGRRRTLFAQKVVPKGEHLTRLFAVAFIAIGIWVASAPAACLASRSRARRGHG